MNLTGVFSKDKQKAYSVIADATVEERQRLQNDATFRENIFSGLSSERQKIALKIAEQGSVRPEDRIRSAVVGFGGASEILAELKGLKPEEIAAVKSLYLKGYGTSFDGDVMHKLSGPDRAVAEQLLSQSLNAETRSIVAQVATGDSRTGFGAWFSDFVARSGTGAQAEDARNQTNRRLTDKNTFQQTILDADDATKKLVPEDLDEKIRVKQDLQRHLTEAIDFENQATQNLVDSKKKAGDYVGDAAIATAAVASIVLSGGVDAPLVAALVASGATLKIGTNSLMQGSNYDWSASNVATDGTIGAIMAGTSVIGPGQLAALFNLGESAAKESTLLTLASLTRLGQTETLSASGQQILENGAKKIIQNALSVGATGQDANAFIKLAENAVSPELTGQARTEAVKLIANELQHNLNERMATGVSRFAAAQLLNAGGGAIGGGISGFTSGALHWDSTKTVSENLERIGKLTGSTALTAGLTGAAASGGILAAKSLVRSIRAGVETPAVPAPEAPPTVPLMPANASGENLNLRDTAEINLSSESAHHNTQEPEASGENLPPESNVPQETLAEPEVRGHSIESGDSSPLTAPRAELNVPLLSNPEIAQKLRQRVEDVTHNWSLVENLSEAELSSRRAQLEETINRFLVDEKLPRVSLVIDDAIKSGEGSYWDGAINLSLRDFEKPTERLTVAIGHELNHADQDFLRICQAADRLNVEKLPTQAQSTNLAEELKMIDDNENAILSPFAQEVLAKRGGVQLSAGENVRADMINEAKLNYRAPDGRWTYGREHLEGLETQSAFDEFTAISRLQSLKWNTLVQKLLGKETPSPEVQELINKARSINEGKLPKASWKEQDAKAVLTRVYRTELINSREEEASAYRQYKDNLLEKESSSIERNLRKRSSPQPGGSQGELALLKSIFGNLK